MFTECYTNSEDKPLIRVGDFRLKWSITLKLILSCEVQQNSL